MQCQHLSEHDIKSLCNKVRNILMEESNIQPVSSPVTICGDIHGQFWDLLQLLREGGNIPDTSYIFMGRICPLNSGGRQERMMSSPISRVILLTGAITAWKQYHCCSHSRQGSQKAGSKSSSPHLLARYPDKVTLLRGNHESRQITQVYGFYGLLQPLIPKIPS